MAERTRLFESPLWPTLITLLTLMAGILGSVYTDEIKKSFPFAWTYDFKNFVWSWQSFSFWLSGLAASLVFFFRQQADDASRREAHNQLVEQAKKLQEAVETLPPPHFLKHFSKLLFVADQTSKAAFAPSQLKATKDECALYIRTLLRSVAVLAQRYDGDDSEATTYAANIMIFRPVNEIKPEEIKEVESRLIFAIPEITVTKLRGVLELMPELSTTATSEDYAPDPKMERIALPIPIEGKFGDKFRLLPGAPLAFVDEESDCYSDTSDIVDWCRNEGAFPEEVNAVIGKFFKGASHIQSFISIPMYQNSGDPNEKPFAVLNIHCNRPGLLRQGQAVANFEPVTDPFAIYLADLIKAGGF